MNLNTSTTSGGNLNSHTYSNSEKNSVLVEDDEFSEGDVVVHVDRNNKQIGLISATCICLNRMLGAGIFSTGSTVYALSGSVGTSLLMWAAGTIIAMSGLFVYMEFGSAIHRNGGEKNYLEFIYTKPRFLVTAMYGSYIFLLGWAAGNSIVVGEYLLNAAGVEATRWNSRAIGVGTITFAFLVNGVYIRAGLLLSNLLGLFKIIIVLIITVTGWVALGGGIKNDIFKPTHNFSNAFEGPKPTGYGIVNALYNVIWSFVGYSNINYALGETKNPVKALKIAAPAAFGGLAIIYMFVNIAYFAVIPLSEFADSGQQLAAVFFLYAFGKKAEKASSVFVALSALANVISVIFAQGRIIQQLGREGALPFSRFFSTQRPFNTPFVGLMQHWIICIITILAPPPNDAYNFILNLTSYPLNIINAAIALGLLYIRWKKSKGEIEWNPKLRSPVIVTIFFFLSSLYLVVAPYIPPSNGTTVYKNLPYWIHPVVTWGVFGVGAFYWLVWAKILPRIGGYTIKIQEELGEDGYWRNTFTKIPIDELNRIETLPEKLVHRTE